MSARLHERRKHANLVLAVAVTVVVIALDQWTKTLVVDDLHSPVHLAGPLSLRLVYNSGVAFSIGTGLGLPIVLLALVGLAAFALRRRHALTGLGALGAGLVAGGALSNLGDRLFRGHGGSVVDFIYTPFWPTFNFADSAVVCGCAVLFLSYWRPSRSSGAADPPWAPGDGAVAGGRAGSSRDMPGDGER